MKKNITFKVYFLPETVAIEQPAKLVENTEANFTCTSSASNPGADIIWRYNNNVMAGPDTTPQSVEETSKSELGLGPAGTSEEDHLSSENRSAYLLLP